MTAKPSKQAMYLVVLEGQGDKYVTLVSKTTWDWISSEPPADHDGGWHETVPESNPPEEVCISIGSYDNDRAIHCNGQSFESQAEARRHAKANGMRIVDTYRGCIY